jgi:hypothetical protein
MTTNNRLNSQDFIDIDSMVEETLNRLRLKLLDLTRKNNFINFKETNRSIRIVDICPDVLFHHLVTQSKSYELKALNSKDSFKKQVYTANLPSPLFYPPSIASFLGKISSWKNEKILQTPYQLEIFDKKCSEILRCRQAGIAEAGINILYLAMGFVCWPDDSDEKKMNKSPLFLVPISKERLKIDPETEKPGYAIAYTGEDIEINLSLCEKLKYSHGIDIPEIEGLTPPEAYMDIIRRNIKPKREWYISSEMHIGIFNFSKIRIYKDLDPDNWPRDKKILQHPMIQHVLVGKEISCANKGLSDVLGTSLIDSYNGNLPLIMDADSSQRMAIQDAVILGKNLVIDGPPGTGKSQTIANLIALAIQSGKKVLFVADKKAALEVVKKRLDSKGLGAFCSELHSHKTGKNHLYTELSKRLSLKPVDAPMIEDKIYAYNQGIRRLKNYYHSLQAVPGKTGETIQAIFWKTLYLQDKVHGYLVQTDIKNALDFKQNHIENIIVLQKKMAVLHKELPEEVIDAWQGFELDMLIPGDENQIISHFGLFNKELQKLDKSLKNFISLSNIELSDHVSELMCWRKIDTDLLALKPKSWNQRAASKMNDDSGETNVADLIEHVEYYKKLESCASKIIGDYQACDRSMLDDITPVLEILNNYCFQDQTLDQMLSIKNRTESTILILEKMLAENKSDWYGNGTVDKLSDFSKIVSLNELFEQAPLDVMITPCPQFAAKPAAILLSKAYDRFKVLKQEWTEVSKVFKIDQNADIDKIEALVIMAATIDFSWKCIFSGHFKKFKQLLSPILYHTGSVKNPEIFMQLKKLSNVLKNIRNFNKKTSYVKILGDSFKGMETNWDELKKTIGFCTRLSLCVGSESIARQILENFEGHRETVSALCEKIDKWLEEVENFHKISGYDMAGQSSLQDMISHLKTISLAMDKLEYIANNFQLNPDSSIFEIARAVEIAKKSIDQKNRIEKNQKFHDMLGQSFIGVATDIGQLKKMLNWVSMIKIKSKLDPAAIQWILSSDTDHRIADLTIFVSKCRKLFNDIQKLRQELQSFGTFAPSHWLAKQCQNLSLSDLNTRVEQCIHFSKYLITWSDYCSSRRQLACEDMDGFIRVIEDNTLLEDDLRNHFLYCLYHQMTREILSTRHELNHFNGSMHEDIMQHINHLDKDICRMFHEKIASRLGNCEIPLGNGKGYIRDYTELSLIRHELSKKRKRASIRELIERSPNAIQALKPCFMMSPLSLAQYLAPGKITFDLVVMDEASQLRLEDSVGAVARGNQLIVIGDQKQLPPTSFFEKIIERPDQENATAADDSESILDICKNRFKANQCLRWHYRSENPELIEFSNQHFYHNNLLVFPSANPNHPDSGIHYHYIANAVYRKGENTLEAQKVVRQVMHLIKKYPEYSIGVATFNLPQKNLIISEIEKLKKEYSWLDTWINNALKKEEPFFVKNLENIQGDERDIIIISATYGPDKSTGKVYQRFGPLTAPMGWRRLNVIITRARKRLDIFTALKSKDITSSQTVSRGVQSLRAFLAFIECEDRTVMTSEIGEQWTSSFEQTITGFLARNGFSCSKMICMDGAWSHIGVCDPDDHKKFILGITFDSLDENKNISIHDQDVLIHRLAGNSGWDMYRIWTPDWIKNSDKEMKKLINLLHLKTGSTLIQPDNLNGKENIINLNTEKRSFQNHLNGTYGSN